MRQSHFERNGFTLVELIITVSVIAILSTILLISYHQYLDKARRTVSVHALENLGRLLETYFVEHGSYPGTFNFTDCTDGSGHPIVQTTECEQLKKDVYSFDSYTLGGTTYTIMAKAVDSTHSMVKLSSNRVELVP